MSLWVLVAGVLVLGGALTVALDRNLKRAQRERRLREWAKTSPDFQRIARSFDAMKVAIGTAMLPSMQQAAAALSKFGAAANTDRTEEATS
jgi:hypothetical protein